MKLGIMQPYFFPYIGYFSLISNVDEFVFFDTPQYEPRSWMNRNRIINLKDGFTYITAAVRKAPQKTPIKDIYLAEPALWHEKLLAQLTVYKKRAPHYQDVIGLIREISCRPYERLSELNISSTKAVCEYLGIPLRVNIFSEMDLELGEVHEPDEWALEITKAMGYAAYVNPPGGISFFNRGKYADAGIELQFLQADCRAANYGGEERRNKPKAETAQRGEAAGQEGENGKIEGEGGAAHNEDTGQRGKHIGLGREKNGRGRVE